MSGKMRDLIGLINPSWRGAQKCEACGEDFICGAALTGCWCTEIKLSGDVRAKLREKYQHCLCRECLEKQSTEC